MFKKMISLETVCVLIGLIFLTSGTAQANWLETFGGNDFNLAVPLLPEPDQDIQRNYTGRT